MTKSEKAIALFAIDRAEELCKSIEGFDKLNDESKAIATIFATITILNKAFKNIIIKFK